jgi:hypothetical protein
MRFFKTLHFLSLDVVIGACLFQYLVTSMFMEGQFPPFVVTLALAFSVWTIYLVDRFIDNRKPIAHSVLHDFHLKHITKITYLIVCNILSLLVIIIYLPKYLIINGFCIGFFILIYWALLIFGLFDRVRFLKEILTALIYTIGIFLYVFLNVDQVSFLFVSILVLLFLLAFQNLILFTLLSKSELKRDFLLICVEVICICLWFAIFSFAQLSIFLLLPFLVTFVIHLWIHYISKSKQWVWLGELAFFSPLLYYLYAIIST